MIVFLSNYYNHHQAPFSEAMYRLTKGAYRFIATDIISEERLKLGYEHNTASFVMRNWETPDYCKKCIDQADVVIWGSAPYSLIKNRLKLGKLTFVYSEHIYKQKCTLGQFLLRYVKNYYKFGRYSNFYLLCASAYSATDYARTRTFVGKTYRWGYFPCTKLYDNIRTLISKKTSRSILWCARLLNWKHPETPIKIAKKLRDTGYQFELNMIGNGEQEASVRDMIVEYGVQDCVHMLGAIKATQVREYMEKSEIFMFTSDRNEGWGVVLNEAMNSGCAVVANKAIGSVPYLLKNGENGIIYQTEEELYDFVKELLENKERQERLGEEAYHTIVDTWNAEVAANRLINLIDRLNKKEVFSTYTAGPCSYDDSVKPLKKGI